MDLPRPRNWQTRLLSKSVWMATAPFRARFRRAANQIRQRYGLPPLRTSVLEFTGTMPLYLVMGTSEFDYERRDLPPSVHYVGACLWDKPVTRSLRTGWSNCQRTSLGCMPARAPYTCYRRLCSRPPRKALANLPMQVILTTGGNREPSELDLGPIAPNVHVVRWVSHTELLPRLDVMITTGGSATVQSTLKAGVPLIVVPTEWDKPDIARRVVETGAGIRLEPSSVRRKRLRAAVEQVLGTPSFRQNAQRMAAAFARYGGPQAAARPAGKAGWGPNAGISSDYLLVPPPQPFCGHSET
jgi:MGT family glycosyltransferase